VHPRLHGRYRWARLPGEGVLLLSQAGDVWLQGAAFEAVVPLLDGRRSDLALARALGTHLPAVEVFQALERLRQLGALDPASAEVRPAPRRRPRRDGPTVRLITRGVAARSLREALHHAGWRLRRDARTWLVLADDCLSPDLERIDRAARRARCAWLLVVPASATPSVGPFFPPDEACAARAFDRLRARLRRNRVLDVHLRSRGAVPRYARPLSSDNPILPRLLARAKRMLQSRGRTVVLELWDEQVARWRRHPVPDATAPRVQQPLLQRADLIDPVTGVILQLQRVAVPTLPPLKVWVASSGSGRPRAALEEVLRDLRQQPSGRGATIAGAQQGAMGEAIERYAGEWQGSELRRRGSLHSLGDRAMHPNDVAGFSATQLRRPSAQGVPSRRVPRPLRGHEMLDWSPVQSLTHNEERWLPSSLLYYGHPESCQPGVCLADSNGCAAGPTFGAALSNALLELAERDAIAMWWYNRVRRPALDLAGVRDAWCRDLIAALRSADRDVWVLDVTNDLGIPTYAAVSRSLTGRQEILLGFGAHLDPRQALRRALGEMGQMFAATRSLKNDPDAVAPDVRAWLQRASVGRQTYLQPLRGAAVALPTEGGEEPLHREIARRMHARGLEILVLDQTRAEVGIPVVRAIVPGLRHFWPRFAPGRLYGIPVQLGWIRRAQRENELNPIACFL
jgi:oxazoline/thiazoline synthase